MALSDNLKAYYKMNEASWAGNAGEVKDSSGNDNHAKRYGDATTTTGGLMSSRCGTFDGTGDYVRTDANVTGEFEGHNHFSIQCWIKGASGFLDAFKAFFERQEHFQLDGGSTAGKVRFIINIGSSWKFAPNPSSVIDDGNWHHIVGVYDGTSIYLYQDGSSQGTPTTQSGNITGHATDKVLRIAADASNSYNPDCEMDEVAIWDRALSSDDVTALYNGGDGVNLHDISSPSPSESPSLSPSPSESPSLSPSPSESPSLSPSVSESPSESPSLSPSPSESPSLSPSPSESPSLSPSVSESPSISPSSSESPSLSPSPSESPSLSPSVSESPSLSPSPSESPSLSPSVSESPSESPSLSPSPSESPSLSPSPSESPSLSPSPSESPSLSPSVSESPSESPSLSPSPSESPSLSPSPSESPSLSPSVSESPSLSPSPSESPSESPSLSPSVSESPSESPSVSPSEISSESPSLSPSVSESPSESPSISPSVSESPSESPSPSEGSPDRYWVGGTGNWSEVAHWSYTSGGDGGATLPDSTKNVFIDENSGFGAGGTLTFNGDGYCHDFTCTSGHTFTLLGSGGGLIFSGSIVLESGITASTLQLYPSALSGNETITTAGCVPHSFEAYLSNFKTSTATWTLLDDLELFDNLDLEYGTFDANNFNVTADDFYFYAATGYTPTVIMGSGTWEATGIGSVWEVSENNSQVVTFTPETSTIKFSGNTEDDKIFNGGGKIYNNIWITGGNEDNVGQYYINGSNTFNDFKIDSPPHVINFEAGTTTTVTTFTVSGVADKLVQLNSTLGGTQFNLSKSSGVVSCDYLELVDSNATGGALWYAGWNSLDTTNNDGWIFGEPGNSPSESPSESPSLSPSVSESPSISPSVSESPSESPSESSSLSPSVSESPSLSPSPSESPSLSPSVSVSPSESPSISPSVSESPSLSPSVSESPSLSPSVSISPSESPSESPSLSPSVSESPSVSPSPSPGWVDYTKGDYATLPEDKNDLENTYTATEVTNVGTSNNVRVSQSADGEFAVHQYKDYLGDVPALTLYWEGQTNKAPALSTVYLQIFNVTSSEWETVDSDNTSSTNTDFILTGTISDSTNYLDGGVATCRIYQEAP